MASSSSGWSLSDALLCPVCYGQIKTPKMLPCGHSFCLEPCLKNLLEAPHSCPLCRQAFQSPASGLAEDFPTNFALRAIVSPNVASETYNAESIVSNVEAVECQSHKKTGDYFCSTCVELLCEECHSTHDSNHVIEEVSKISERKISELRPMMEDIANSLEAIRKMRERVKDARSKSQTSNKEAKADIGEAASSVIGLVRKRESELLLDANRRTEASTIAMKKLEIQMIDLEYTANNAKRLGQSLLKRLKRKDIQENEVGAVLAIQQKKIKSETANLEKQADGDKIEVKFDLQMPTDISFGEVKHVTKLPERVKYIVSMQSNQIGCGNGYVWFSLYHLLIVRFEKGKIMFSPFSRSVKTNVSVANVSTTNLARVSPTLGKDGRSLLMNNSKNVIKLTFDLETGTTSLCKRTIDNTMLYSIVASSWDAAREGCYALMQDRISICHFTFDEPEQPCQYTQLAAEVNCSSACQFHVSESGGMALCDGEAVKYFAKVQPRVTLVVEAPSECVGAEATCLTSRDCDNKWFVNWFTVRNNQNAIVQYSDDFKLERVFAPNSSPEYSPNDSLHFMNGKYFIKTSTYMLSICSIEP